MPNETYPTRQLCNFLAQLKLSDVPAPVVERTKDLFLDWIASALATAGVSARSKPLSMRRSTCPILSRSAV